MSVLDRLEQEAREARARRDAAQTEQRDRVEQARSRLAPALRTAADYFERMARHLGDRDEQVRASYSVSGVGTLADLLQEGYHAVREEDGARVQLRFACTGPNPIGTRIEGTSRAQSLARELREAGLTCELGAAGAQAMNLRVAPRVPVSITLSADVERDRVVIELRNLPDLGTQRYLLEPGRVDTALLDAVAGMVLREPNRFAELTGSVVADADRAEMQRNLKRETRRRDAELAGGMRRALFPLAEWFRRQFLRG